MKSYQVTYKISGIATAIVKANSERKAIDKATCIDIEDGSDQLIEWSFEDPTEISEIDE